VGAISEILQAQSGQHEWRLLLPALRSGACGPVVLVGAPHVPFGPGLRAQGLATHRLLWINTATPVARLWSAEQALRCAEVAAVLLWLPQARPEQLRRLQIAAAEYAKLLFVMRPAQAQSEASPAVLRLLVCNPPATGGARADALQVQLLKRRGPPLEQALVLPARCAQLAALLALSGAGNVLDRLAVAA
jgi:protein ImuA